MRIINYSKRGPKSGFTIIACRKTPTNCAIRNSRWPRLIVTFAQNTSSFWKKPPAKLEKAHKSQKYLGTCRFRLCIYIYILCNYVYKSYTMLYMDHKPILVQHLLIHIPDPSFCHSPDEYLRLHQVATSSKRRYCNRDAACGGERCITWEKDVTKFDKTISNIVYYSYHNSYQN